MLIIWIQLSLIINNHVQNLLLSDLIYCQNIYTYNKQRPMQPRPTPSKPKFKLKDFEKPGNCAVNKQRFLSNDSSCKLFCICNQYSLQKSTKCERCKQSYHNCVAGKSIKTSNWQCLRCKSKFMDPIFMPDQILIQTFFKTQSIYQCSNIIQFAFVLTPEQLRNPVQIRGLQDGRDGLAWPMQGQLFLNRQNYPQCIIDFKPLLKNSNRKHRKQQAIIFPADKLKLGKNVLTFSIPRLNSIAFEAKYQAQVKATYFMGIYSIKKYAKQQLIQKTFQTSKIDKPTSLKLLQSLLQVEADSQLSVQKIKLCLQCPYMKSRIKIPVRGKLCSHYTCICLDTLIQTRTGLNSRQWLCPICNSNINEPVIDMFILSMLNDGSAGIQVVLYITGKYQWVAYEDDDISLSSQQINQKKNQSKIQQSKKPVEQKPEITKNSNIQKQKQNKIVEKPIQTINLDDQQIPLKQPPVVTKAAKQIIQIPKPAPFQIMIPEQTNLGFNKEKQKNLIKERLKQSLKQSKRREHSQLQFARSNPKKDEYYITDIKLLQFRPLTYNEFTKKYFSFQYSRAKLSEDLKIIFKEVL